MHKTHIFCLFALFFPLYALKAELFIKQYDPLLFKLQFSQPVEQPNFQLLYNNIYSIPHLILTNETISSEFIIEGDITRVKVGSNLQAFSLMFNNPLSVGGGTLALADFKIKAEKIPVTINFQQLLGIMIITGVYFFNLFTETGTMLAQFIHVYVLYMFESKMSTTIYRQLYMGTLMLPPTHILAEETYDQKMFVILCLAFPPLLLLFFGVVGVIIKKWAPKERTIIWNQVYKELVFSTFLRMVNIFQFNLIYNGIQYLTMTKEAFPFIEEVQPICGILVYFNFLTYAFLIYLKIYVLNPKKGQTRSSFQKYLKSKQFDEFRLIHEKNQLDRWYRRNFEVLNGLKNGLIAVIFFWGVIFKYMMLLLEFLHIFAIFTLLPFKQDFYKTIKIVCRLLFLAQYIFIVLGFLYFAMSPVVFNYQTVSKLLTAQVALFFILLFAIFIVIFVEIYFKCTNLNYQIKLVKEENQFKLQILEKKDEEQDTRKTKQTLTSDQRSKSSAQVAKDLFDLSSPECKKPKESGLRTQLLDDGQKDKNKIGQGKKTKDVQIEMMDMCMSDISCHSSKRKRKRKTQLDINEKQDKIVEEELNKQL